MNRRIEIGILFYPSWSTRRAMHWLFACAVLLSLVFATGVLAAEWGMKIRDTVEDTGAEVIKIFPDSIAAQAGLRSGDIIYWAAGRSVNRASEVYDAIGQTPDSGDARVLRVTRNGQDKQLTLQAQAEATTKKRPAKSAWADESDRSWTNQIYSGGGDAPVKAQADEEAAEKEVEKRAMLAPPLPPLQPGEQRPRATVLVGDLQAKAANTNASIGDGLREMLITALHNNGRFIVVERMELQSLAAEQAMSRSRLAQPGTAFAEGKMDIAEIIVVGAVTEFEPEAGGTGINLGFTKLPFSFGRKSTNAHMAIDVRVVDIASGRVLGSKRIKGKASSSQTTVGLAPKVGGGGRIPVSLGSFQNTPMEEAIRGCIEQSIDFIVSTVPQQYYRLQ